MSPWSWIIGVFMALQALVAVAQPVPEPGQPAGPSALGRLFYTPKQRAAMDLERRALLAKGTRPSAKPLARVKPGEAAEKPAASGATYILRGIVRRSDGEATVWINDEAVSERMGERGIVRDSLGDESAELRLRESGRQVRLRVGQSVDSSSNGVVEPYRRRFPPTPPPPPATPPVDPRN